MNKLTYVSFLHFTNEWKWRKNLKKAAETEHSRIPKSSIEIEAIETVFFSLWKKF